MPAASGIFKKLAYKVETTIGTVPANDSSAKYLRRVTSDISITKDTYQSNEIRTDQQMQDMRHGVRRAQGTINGELSPGTYADFVAAALRKDFAAVSSLTGLSLTIAASSPNYTLTRGSGDYLTGGMKVGDVVRVTAGTGLNADVLNKNMLIVALTATVMTVRILNGSTITAGSGTSCTIALTGKKTWAATSSHTNKSYSIEHWFSDLVQSEVYTGCQPSTLD